jgi:hypothetical protein
MRKLLCLRIVLACLPTISFAQTITQNFGSGANAFSIDFVQIGNPGNAADTTGTPNLAGSVSYTYNIAKYEISRDIVTKVNNSYASAIFVMDDLSSWGGNGPNKPATGLSWNKAAQFVNQLNAMMGAVGAYNFDLNGDLKPWDSSSAGFNASNPYRNSLAKFFLPSSNEFYKAAFGSPDGTWYDYATGSDAIPFAVISGTDPNTAVYNNRAGPADVMNAGGLSAWGTIAQSGNVWEITESAIDGFNDSGRERKEMRGGAWSTGTADLSSSERTNAEPYAGYGSPDVGFRIAMVPEPSSTSLLLIGMAGLASRRLLKRKS